jgi:hypothetical protein
MIMVSESIMLLVVFVDKGGGEVATVLQHLYHVPPKACPSDYTLFITLDKDNHFK